MKIEVGKYYKTNDGSKYGPAREHPTKANHFYLFDPSAGLEWIYTEDGIFLGGYSSHPRTLVDDPYEDMKFEIKRATFPNEEKPAKEKQIYEMKLEDYKRGIDAIWDSRHLSGV